MGQSGFEVGADLLRLVIHGERYTPTFLYASSVCRSRIDVMKHFVPYLKMKLTFVAEYSMPK